VKNKRIICLPMIFVFSWMPTWAEALLMFWNVWAIGMTIYTMKNRGNV